MGNCLCLLVPDDDDECQPVTQPSNVSPSFNSLVRVDLPVFEVFIFTFNDNFRLQ